MSLLDLFFPSRVEKRLVAKIMGSLAVREKQQRIATSEFMARHFQSASEDRRRPGWNLFSLSGDREALNVLPTMRARARLLADNDAKAGGLIHKELTNVIGPAVSVQAVLTTDKQAALGLKPDQAKELTDQAERFYRNRIANSGNKNLDWRKMRTFFQYIRLAYRHVKVDGGVFLRFLFKPGRAVPFAVRIIEPECIGTPPHLVNRKDVKGGLQFNKDGELTGFHVASNHPGELYAGAVTYEFVPVRNELGLPEMIFFFEPNRETSSREMPWLQRVLVLINDSADYKDSELQRKIKEADIAWFLSLNDPDLAQEQMESDTAFGRTGSQKNKRSQVKHAKRLVYYLEANEKINVVDSDRPGGNYQPFLDSHDRDIGQGIGRSFERVSNNYGAANFSATRVSGIEDFVEQEIEFKLFAEGVLDPIWEWAMWSLSMETGNTAFRQVTARWQRYVKPSWDNLKDSKAATDRMMNGTQSVIEESNRLGSDWETIQDNRLMAEKREMDERKRLGLPPRPTATLNDPAVVAKPKKPTTSPSSKTPDFISGDNNPTTEAQRTQSREEKSPSSKTPDFTSGDNIKNTALGEIL